MYSYYTHNLEYPIFSQRLCDSLIAMPIVNIDDFCNALKGGALLGIDVGAKTFGLSICDIRWYVASPLFTHQRTQWRKDGVKLLEIFDQYDIRGLVVGWPLLMNGDLSARCHSTRHVVENILSLRDMPCLLWDERLSTHASLRILRDEADLSRQKRSKAIDAVASAWFLQGALDVLKKRVSEEII